MERREENKADRGKAQFLPYFINVFLSDSFFPFIKNVSVLLLSSCKGNCTKDYSFSVLQ